MADPGRAPPLQGSPGRSLLPVAVIALVWGCNWPVLKLGVTELARSRSAPRRFPSPASACSWWRGSPARASASPRALWGLVATLAFFNITGWNGLVLFGLQQMPAGRSAIIAYTMPVWATLVSLAVLQEPIGKRKAVGLLLGMAGMAVLLGDDLRAIERRPFAALMILGAAFLWACGTVLLRKHKPSIPQNVLTGWMMIVGWIPLAIAAPFFDPGVLAQVPTLSGTAWFAILYNIFMAGTLAHWAWFTLARTLPVAVSSLASLPVPVVGVFAGMLVLGERPGAPEWIALALVLAALGAVLWPASSKPSSAAPVAPDD